MRPGREVDHSPPFCAEVKNAWICTSTPQYVLMAWCLVKHKDNFTFTFPCNIVNGNGNECWVTPLFAVITSLWAISRAEHWVNPHSRGLDTQRCFQVSTPDKSDNNCYLLSGAVSATHIIQHRRKLWFWMLNWGGRFGSNSEFAWKCRGETLETTGWRVLGQHSNLGFCRLYRISGRTILKWLFWMLSAGNVNCIEGVSV
jgi:hypothetical protein